MEITLTTPAILFPAVSLLLVAYTNRFNAVSMRIRSLHAQYKENPDILLEGQIDSLRKRINIIKNMQRFGVLSLFLCVFCLVVLFGGNVFWGKVVFGLSLIFMMFSLGLALWEISLSVEALNIELSDMQR